MIIINVKSVMHRPRRMVRWNIERFEIVIIVFDLRPLYDIEA
jgi:hypothetical protein